MAGEDDPVNFKRSTARRILESVGHVPATRDRPDVNANATHMLMGTTKVAIAAGASGLVYVRTQTAGVWSDSADEYTAYNVTLTTIPITSRVLMLTINGLWCIIGVC